jgi:hypothetical protein
MAVYIAQIPQPAQSSQGIPAISAARIVGDHRMSRLEASCSFQRSMTAFASARAAASAKPLGIGGNVEAPRPTPMALAHRPSRARPSPGSAVLDLDPISGRPGPIGRRQSFRHDSFRAHGARLLNTSAPMASAVGAGQ